MTSIQTLAPNSAPSPVRPDETEEPEKDLHQKPHLPLQFKERRTIGRALDAKEAVGKLLEYLDVAILELSAYGSGLLRLEVMIPGGGSALEWFRNQESVLQHHLGFYFRHRDEARAPEAEQMPDVSNCFCGVGQSWLWKGMNNEPPTGDLFEAIHGFLDPQEPSIKCMGATRFEWEGSVDEQWEQFGSYLFFIPAVEYSQGHGEDILACTLVWQEAAGNVSFSSRNGARSPNEAASDLKCVLSQISTVTSNIALTPSIDEVSIKHTPCEKDWMKLLSRTAEMLKPVKPLGQLSEGLDTTDAVQEYLESGQQGLDDLLMAMNASTEIEQEDPNFEKLSKLVLARKTDLQIEGTVNPQEILQHLQDRDAASYQFCLSLPKGGSFVGSTPERLYLREGTHVTTEALAGTRPRGPKGTIHTSERSLCKAPSGNLEKDFLIGLQMLRDPKDHVEFILVRDWLMDALQSICTRVHVDIPKSVTRRATVQHLYGRLRGDLKQFQSDFEILQALHPTPAVCGRPQNAAKETLRQIEGFDRGYYAGPLGWISGQGAEFVVAIRSGLIKPQEPPSGHQISLYAGVGTVKESNPVSEWKELELKVSPFTKLLSPRVSPLSAPNANIRMAALMVEELCRSGIQTFAVAPGSRSSPLVYAAATNPNCHIYSCIDERSLGFWSVGYARATGRPAPVITSSGTAVANLMPSVVEASLSKIPLLILTADRPSDLRCTGANQTIDQVKLFGDYVNYFHDIPPPSENDPAHQLRSLLTMVDAAVRHACGSPGGPVHLNCQFTESLAPTENLRRDQADDTVLEHWWKSGQPFTRSLHGSIPHQSLPSLPNQVWQCDRGLLVVGELMTALDRSAALEIAQILQWPCVVDVLSGLKTPFSENPSTLIFTADQLLASDAAALKALKPSMVLQLGGHLTSKRLMKYLEACRTQHPEMEWIQISQDIWRDDPTSLVTLKASTSLPVLRSILEQKTESRDRDDAYLKVWKAVDDAVSRSLELSMQSLSTGEMTEPYASYLLSQMLPPGQGLFLGNGMPIRDMDMFGGISLHQSPSQRQKSIQAVGANRGASGIDGVLSTAIGYGVGLKQPVTLLIGDVSFLHDSNGLNFLRSETWPPITIVIINNSGGGIFDFLPIADAVPSEMFDSLWSMPQYTNIAALCQAYGVAHHRVTQPQELQGALEAAWSMHQHSIVEVVTSREGNVALHRQIQSMAAFSVSKALQLQSILNISAEPRITDVSWSRFSLPLRAPLTTGSTVQSRDGILLKITLKNASGEWVGIGEVAPLEGLHQETLKDTIPQLRYLKQVLWKQSVPWDVCQLNGKMSHWLDDAFGIEAQDLLPSVRFGLDSALLTALAHIQGVSLHELYSSSKRDAVSVNGLLGSLSDPDAAIHACTQLVGEGYPTVKIKVGRLKDPAAEAQAINRIAQQFGAQLKIRLDANQAWSLPEALCFAERLSCSNLEYIEEPVADLADLNHFCQLTGLPVALDESLVHCQSPADVAALLQRHKGVMSCVIKPSCLGGIETVMQLIETCASQKCTPVISSAFESPTGLALLAELAAMSDAFMERTCGTKSGSVSHGLGTLSWFESNPDSSCLMTPTITLSHSWQLTQRQISPSDEEPLPVERLGSCKMPADGGSYLWSYHEVEDLSVGEKPVLLLLHGFLGSSKDWLPIMHSLSDRYRCIAVDLPGHGNSTVQSTSNKDLYDFSRVCEAIVKLLEQLQVRPYAVIGYSMGGRLAQQLSLLLHCPKLIVVSGSPGIADSKERAARLAADLQTVAQLENGLSIESFLERWYQGSPLWSELRRRERLYRQLCARRSAEARPNALGRALLGLSAAQMPFLAPKLASTQTKTLFLCGSKDHKFQRLFSRLDRQFPNGFQFEHLARCSHGLLAEAGVRLSSCIREFL